MMIVLFFCTGKDKFNIEKLLGEGSYAKVFRATDMETQKTVALKVQKPSWEWEFYICRQLQSRLSDPLSVSSFLWNVICDCLKLCLTLFCMEPLL
jgi:hypothetical protein